MGKGVNIPLKIQGLREAREDLAKLNEEFEQVKDDPIKSKKIETPKPGPEDMELEDLQIVLLEVEPAIWQRFEHQCLAKEDKDPVEKIKEMINDYSLPRGD